MTRLQKKCKTYLLPTANRYAVYNIFATNINEVNMYVLEEDAKSTFELFEYTFRAKSLKLFDVRSRDPDY